VARLPCRVEKYHSAMVPHAGADTEVFREVCRLGQIAARLGEIVGSTVQADVALLWDYEAAWTVAGPAVPSNRVDYADVALQLHGALRDLGVAADVVHPGADLTAYRLVVVPTLQLVRNEHATAIRAAAEAGAHVLVTYLSGIVDEHDHIRLGGYPGAFRELLGVRVEEFRPLLEGQSRALDDSSRALLWTEDLDTTTATPVVRYADTGRPALTRNEIGAGSAWYLSYLPERDQLATLVRTLLDLAKVTSPVAAPSGVELVRRARDERTWLFAINHTDQPQELPVTGHDLVADTAVTGVLALGPGAVAVVREA